MHIFSKYSYHFFVTNFCRSALKYCTKANILFFLNMGRVKKKVPTPPLNLGINRTS